MESILLDLVKLIGIVIIVVGFRYKFDVLAVVVMAAFATGLVSGLSANEILNLLGEAFVKNRLMSIFLISLPVIALIERYGLRERSSALIEKLKNASAGAILSIYMIVRIIASILSIRISGHVQFVRPLILPMSESAGEKFKGAKLSEKELDKLKGLAAAVENYANFFGQNVFIGASGVLLIQGTLASAGYDVTIESIALSSIPIAIASIILAIAQVVLFDRKIKKEAKI